jgi:hypothetical protein
MFDKLGLGWGNSLLAFVALALGIVYPIFLWRYVRLFYYVLRLQADTFRITRDRRSVRGGRLIDDAVQMLGYIYCVHVS